MKKAVALIAAALAVLTLCSCYRSLIEWQREEIKAVDSPSGKYTVRAYLSDGGATTDWLVECFVVNNDTGAEREVYHQYHEKEAFILWIGDEEVVINGVKLNVLTDQYVNNDREHPHGIY